jgi:hypothetical protein
MAEVLYISFYSNANTICILNAILELKTIFLLIYLNTAKSPGEIPTVVAHIDLQYSSLAQFVSVYRTPLLLFLTEIRISGNTL